MAVNTRTVFWKLRTYIRKRQWRVCNTVEDTQYSGGISSVQWRIFNSDCTVLMISLHSSEYPPLYLWYPSIVLHIFNFIDDILPLYWTSSTVLHTLHCTAQTLPGVFLLDKKVEGLLSEKSRAFEQAFTTLLILTYWSFKSDRLSFLF